jgi:hypothetical protein
VLWAETVPTPAVTVTASAAVPVGGGCAAALRLDGPAYAWTVGRIVTRAFPPLRMAGN